MHIEGEFTLEEKKDTKIQTKENIHRKKELRKRKKQRDILSWIAIVIISILPLATSLVLDLSMLPILIFDVIWFAATLIIFIWTFK